MTGMRARAVYPSWPSVLLAGVCMAVAACDSNETTAVSPRPALTREELLNPETCKDCHPKHYVEWSASMHAYSSKDPVFLAMNKRGQEETDGKLGDFCVQCHAPMALREGKIADLTKIEEVPEQLQGVTCYFCHTAESVGTDHFNNNITLATDNKMRAALDRAQIPSVHGVKYSSNHDSRSADSSVMCGTCHDIVNTVNPSSFHLERTFTEYQTTIVSDPAVPARFQSCNNCHMHTTLTLAAQATGYPGVVTTPRNVHEHLFAAVDVPLTPFPGADAMRAAVSQCELSNSIAFYDVALLSPQGQFEVQIETQAGHAQPSGATQDRRMWLEIDFYDAAGNLINSDGIIADGEVEEPPGKPAHRCMIRNYVADAEGNEAHMFWEAVSETKSKLIPPPTSAQGGTHTLRCGYAPQQLGRPVARLELRLRMRPIGVDILQDLVASGHLAPELVAKMPTFTVDTRTATYDPAINGYRVVKTTPQQDCDSYRALLDVEADGAVVGTGAGNAGAGSASQAGNGL